MRCSIFIASTMTRPSPAADGLSGVDQHLQHLARHRREHLGLEITPCSLAPPAVSGVADTPRLIQT
jgi:hypothetical protein